MRIYMDTAQIQHILREMEQMLVQVQHLDKQFRAALEQLQQVWYGPSPEMYYQQQGGELQYTARYHRFLYELIETLRSELREYQAMDQTW